MNIKTTFTFLFLLTLFVDTIFSQGKPYEGPEDPAGDIAAEKEGYMTGNRVFIYFRNTTELSDWPRVNVSKWPNNPDGLKMTDGIGLLLVQKFILKMMVILRLSILSPLRNYLNYLIQIMKGIHYITFKLVTVKRWI